MTPQDEQKFKDFIFQAVQSGKRETSGLASEILQKMSGHIQESIDISVNGKIKNMSFKLDNYIAQDEEWKKSVIPVIEMGRNLQGASKVMLWVTGGIIAVGGAMTMIRNFLKN